MLAGSDFEVMFVAPSVYNLEQPLYLFTIVLHNTTKLRGDKIFEL